MHFAFGPWMFDPSRCLLITDETEFELDPLSFKLLNYFIAQGQRIVSREELVEQVWQQKFVDDNAINRAISDLRKQLKYKDFKAQVIKTHYRKGYSFQLDVAELTGLTSVQSCKKRIRLQAESTVPVTVNELNKLEETNSQYITPQQNPIDKKKTYLFVKLVILVFFISVTVYFLPTSTPKPIALSAQAKTKLPAIAGSSKVEHSKVNSKPLEYSEEILTWEKGLVYAPKISKNHKLLAYAIRPVGEKFFSLRIKDMHTLSENKILETNYDIFPLTWSKNQELLYLRSQAAISTLSRTIKPKCEIWKVTLKEGVENSQHTRLLDCKSDKFISAAITQDSNQLLYTRSHYRGIEDLFAVVSRDLSTGIEFQVSSPKNNERGDYLVNLSHKEDKIIFLRKQPTGTDIFITDIDGSNQKKLLTLDYYISAVSWGTEDTTIFWMNIQTQKIITLNLITQELTQEKINTQTRLKKFLTPEFLDKSHFIIGTDHLNSDIDKINLSRKEPEVSEYINSDKHEGNIAPFNNSAASIYNLRDSNNSSSIWLYKDKIRKKILALEFGDIVNIAVSPDDSKFLITTTKTLFIYDTNSLKLINTVQLDGIIKQASWPLADNILLTYAASLKTFAWFYNIENEELTRLTDSQTDSANLIGRDNLVFLNRKFQFIRKDITSGETSVIFTLPKLSDQVWTADSENIYYLNKNNIEIRSLSNSEQGTTIPLSKDKFYLNIQIKQTETEKNLFIESSRFKPNYLVEMKLK